MGVCASVAVFVLGLLWIVGPEETWGGWGFHPMTPGFADLRVITHGAESAAQGYDSLQNNPADPWGRPLNYPWLWQAFSPAGLNRSHTVGLALAMVVGFLAAVCLLMPRASGLLLTLTAAALLSPAVMLGVERGNVDLLLFILVATAVVWVPRQASAMVGILLFGFMLKLYPVFAGVALLRLERRRFLRSLGWLVGLAVGFALFNLPDLARVKALTPQDTAASYGVQVGWMEWGQAGAWTAVTFIGLAIALTALVVMACERVAVQSRGMLDEPVGSLELDAFRAGAAIYSGTFFLGSNYDYRMMFLIFTLPQLVTWLRHERRAVRRGAGFALVMIFLSLWDFKLERVTSSLWGGSGHFVVDQIANWGAFAAIGILAAASLPAWVSDALAGGKPSHPSAVTARSVAASRASS